LAEAGDVGVVVENRLKAGTGESFNPPRRQIHVDQQLHARGRESSRSSPRGVAKGLESVLAFQVGVVGVELIDCVTGTDLADDHANSDPHAANASFAAHNGGITSDAVELVHRLLRCLRLG